MSKNFRAIFVSTPAAGPTAIFLLLLLVAAFDFVVAEAVVAETVVAEEVVAHENAKTGQAIGRSSDRLTDPRGLSLIRDGKWIGEGISYGPYREGQSPGGIDPYHEELAEDLHLLAKHWKLLRMYGADGVTEEVLQIIRDEKLPLSVMLGAWITRESESETLDATTASIAKQANQTQVAEVIRLANRYPAEVVAVSVGNETQVYWSDHLTRPEILVQYIREVRQATTVPVTTADDFNFWNKPASKFVAAEVDFIVTHIHAMWAGLMPETAMPWTETIYGDVCKYHPEKTVVIGEAGWATQVHNEGEQAKLIKGPADEAQQRRYYRRFTAWAREKRICTFFFEAFDEPWKGGPHPNEVEKHWGLFHVDRSPKAALLGTE